MADCKPERQIKRFGGEVWACGCGTVGVTYNGVTVRYSARDFRRLARLLHTADAQLFPAPAGAGSGEGASDGEVASAGGGDPPSASAGPSGPRRGGSVH